MFVNRPTPGPDVTVSVSVVTTFALASMLASILLATVTVRVTTKPVRAGLAM